MNVIESTTQVSLAVTQLLDEAKEAEKNSRRAEPRQPFFRPVTLIPAENPSSQISAYSREISNSGIGLLHYKPIKAGRFVVSIQRANGDFSRFVTDILWCRPCGEGWYLSGGKFLEV